MIHILNSILRVFPPWVGAIRFSSSCDSAKSSRLLEFKVGTKDLSMFVKLKTLKCYGLSNLEFC